MKRILTTALIGVMMIASVNVTLANEKSKKFDLPSAVIEQQDTFSVENLNIITTDNVAVISTKVENVAKVSLDSKSISNPVTAASEMLRQERIHELKLNIIKETNSQFDATAIRSLSKLDTNTKEVFKNFYLAESYRQG